MTSEPVCVVFGVGPGNGEALARRFAAAGHPLALVARSRDVTGPLADELDGARAYACDAADPAAIADTFSRIRDDMGRVGVLLYNAGSGVFKTVDDTGLDEFEAAWRVNAQGLFAAAKAVLVDMRAAGGGSIVVTGATASLRGKANTAAFAAAKAAQRSLSQSLARQLWPENIHVALMIIDGVIETPRTRKRFPDDPSELFLLPADIAEAAFTLTRQPSSAWTFELELRPFKESW